MAEIDAHYEQARVETPEHKIPEGQAIIAEQLNDVAETIRQFLMKTDYYKVDESLYFLHDRLMYVIFRLQSLATKDKLTGKQLSSFFSFLV